MLDRLKKVGKLEEFEIKNSSVICFLLSPGLVIYSILIFMFNPTVVEIYGAREVFGILFLLVGLLPYTKNKKIIDNYGWFMFGLLFLFSHYLIYTTYYNAFSLSYLLGTYITVFGAILLLKDRFLIIVFSATSLLHIILRVNISSLNESERLAIIISMSTIFLFSFIILNNSLRYNKLLLKNNLDLEEKVKSRTKDLELRTNILTKKNKELEEYAYVISHDLKTPIRNIHTMAQWIMDDNKTNLDEASKYNIDLIKEQAYHMDLLVKGILNFSLQEKNEQIKGSVDLNKMVTSLAKANSNEKCNISLQGIFPKVKTIEFQLLEVFQNLIENAIKYNDKKVAIITISYQSINKFHQFSIEDNGIGIEEKYFEKIFRLFQRLDVNIEKDSIGVGLPLIKKIIDNLGGEIWLESKLNIGTTFYFTIPK